MVRLEGSYTFDAPQQAVWEAILDPDVLTKVLPGAEKLEQVAENEYEGVIDIRVGPVQGTFQGKVKLTDVDPPNGYHMELEGQGRPGYVRGQGDIRLESTPDGKTIMHYSGEAQLSGRIASVGQRLIDSTARSLTRQALENLDRIIQARVAAEAAGVAAEAAPVPEIEAPTVTQVATEVAKDVVKDVVRETRITPQTIIIVLLAIIAILLFWWLLFR